MREGFDMPTQMEKAERFRALHARAGAFIIPNPWDVGSARTLAQLNFEALATTSAGFAFSLGKPDGTVDRDTVMQHVSALAAATDLPVSGDLENGYGDAPEIVAETIGLAARAGLVGCSIEDASGRLDKPIYDFAHAVERIRAAVEAARSLPFPFTLTARAENYLHGRADLADTIARLRAYQDAGADVLFAPGLTTQREIAEVVASVDRPVNVLMGLQGAQFNLAELAAMGVKRVSVGGSLCRAAFGALLRAGREMQTLGTFTYANDAVSHREMNALFAPRGR
jgi:2-methylisocitrate lyase-like PEP mutase family enzyme